MNASPLTRALLKRVLSRPVTMANSYQSDCPEDDLRMLRAVKPTFLGRAAYLWVTRPDDEEHFTRARQWAERVHREVDEEMVLQGAIFEAIYPVVNQIPIPAWVFEDMGQKAESRCFRMDDMVGGLMAQPGTATVWGEDGQVPDLAREETFRWFYYRARRYMEAGFEAIHLGQIHLMAGHDRSYEKVEKLIKAIRRAATQYARRGWVLLDTHGHGIARHGNLLFDFLSRPLSSRNLADFPEKVVLIQRGTSLGGRHPGGWDCDQLPTLLEVDNWGGFSVAPDQWDRTDLRLRQGKWGYDDISWLAHQTSSDRQDFLRYAHRWVGLLGEDYHLQAPLTRTLGRAVVEKDGLSIKRYRANHPSPGCPEGFGDEEVIGDLWEENDFSAFRWKTGTAPPVTSSGLSVPEPVTCVGPLQTVLGGIEGDASCPWSRLHHLGDGHFGRTFVLPVAGEFSFFIAVGGTQSDPVRSGGYYSTEPFQVSIPRPGTILKLTYRHEDRLVDWEMHPPIVKEPTDAQEISRASSPPTTPTASP